MGHLRSLRFRLVLLFSLVLLPFAVHGIYQARSFAQISEQNAQDLLIAQIRGVLASKGDDFSQMAGAGELPMGSDGPLSLLLIDPTGKIMAAPDRRDALNETPKSTVLRDVLSPDGVVFRDSAVSGEERIFAIVPIQNTASYALASWSPALIDARIARSSAHWIIPFALWLASIAAAVFATQELVLRHVDDLQARMRSFATDRTIAPSRALSWLGEPREMSEMKADFVRMQQAVSRQEVELETAANAYSALSREIHHRVKNNLQMVNSLMNIQSRTSTPEAVDDIRGLQARIFDLMRVHQLVYEAPSSQTVRVDTLVREMFETIVKINLPKAISVVLELDPIELRPDQAVPFPLLAAEMFRAVVPEVESIETGDVAELVVSLTAEDGTCCLSVEHPLTTTPGSDQMAVRLIEAFKRQLGARIKITNKDGKRCQVIQFAIEPL